MSEDLCTNVFTLSKLIDAYKFGGENCQITTDLKTLVDLEQLIMQKEYENTKTSVLNQIKYAINSL